MDKHHIIYTLCAIIALLQIVAISTKSWSTKTISQGGSSVEVSMGLWEACAKSSNSAEVCSKLDDNNNPDFPSDALKATRAFALLGLFLIIIGILSMIMDKYHSYHVWLLVIGGICSAIANSIWASKFVHDNNYGDMKLGYSFGMNAAAAGLAFITAWYHHSK